jgi:serine phosphatase RsbU (regulator of sigma subunit)
MSLLNPEDVATPARRLPSIRFLFVLIVLLPVVIASAALFVIAGWTGSSVANQQAVDTIAMATDRTSDEVRDFLAQAVRLSNLYARRLADHRLPAENFGHAWLAVMSDHLATDDVASICFGNPSGEATWLSRVHSRLEFGLATRSAGNNATEFTTSPNGAIASTQPLRVYRYDPRERPWYKTALGSDHPLWTPIYFWFPDPTIEPETGTGYTRAIWSPDGKLQGVLVIDVTLGGLSKFLQQLPLCRDGFAFIIDDEGLIVAASEGHTVSLDGKRLPLERSDSAAARAGADLIKQSTGPSSARIYLNNEVARAQVMDMAPFPGIRWKLVTILPEKVFLGQADALRKRAAIIGSVVILGALLLGIVLSRKASAPILELTRHVARVGSGDFDTRLRLTLAKELQVLSNEINQMSAGLQHRLELQQSLAVATHVQQSLLPQNAPTLSGLDVAAHSQYCDETGGDYYDFIDIAELPNRQTLVAVGDVTGHGIGAALLMATARGSVRASAVSGVSLGQIMSRVNHVLAGDARHGLFMTLALLILDPAARTIRYASAGHDAPILYDPARDVFEELQGADIPLGIETDVTYQQYLRSDVHDEAILLVGTDGIWEARNTTGEMFGKARLRELVRAHAKGPAAEIAAALDQALAAFTHPHPLHDDVTFVILKILPQETT